MIPFTLIYRDNQGETVKARVQHSVVPRIGEKVRAPREEQSRFVLTVEHDLKHKTIWVVLD